jgi:ribose 5-phosphate isomerase A
VRFTGGVRGSQPKAKTILSNQYSGYNTLPMISAPRFGVVVPGNVASAGKAMAEAQTKNAGSKSDQEKEAAARASLRFVHEGDIVGLGTGSSAEYAIRFLAERVQAGLKIRGIPTSARSKQLANGLHIPLTTLDEYQQIDVTIDGADEFDPELRLIKGGGGALLREKIVASASKQVVIVTDSSKQVSTLGRFPLPVEVVPFAQAVIARKITALGASVAVRHCADGKAFTTDEGHHILDGHFGQISDPAALAHTLKDMPGVVEHGLFIGLASVVLMGKGTTVLELRGESQEK